MNTHFFLYNIVVLLVIAHFFDSAKDREWTEPIYFNSYPFWLISSTLIMGVALCGIVPVYLGLPLGDVLSYVVAVGGLAAGGYHIPTHIWGSSQVCRNRFSYVLMFLLSLASLALIAATALE